MTRSDTAIAPVFSAASLPDLVSAFARDGFAVLRNCYPESTIDELLTTISTTDNSGPAFRRSSGLFAIRRFLQEIPEAAALVLDNSLHRLIEAVTGAGYFIVKSIYFDKPEGSNWFVAYHQDLSISVDRRATFPGFGPWTVKGDQFAVQPPLPILEDNITVRIHLDDTSSGNGALRVIPGSHLKGICRPESIDWNTETEVVCEVPKGGVMLMRPLLLHASGRTTNQLPRRVIHIEFSRSRLPEGLHWAERQDWN